MTREEIIQIVGEASTRSIMMFLEREDNNTYPNALPSATIVRGNVVFSTQPTMKDGTNADWRMRRSKEDLLEGYTWFSIGTFRGNGAQVDLWTEPVLIKIGRDGIDGQDGRNGLDGVNMEYIYKRVKTLDEFEALEPPESDYYKPDYLPASWTKTPTGVDSEYQVEAVCSRSFNPDTGLWSDYSDPAIFAMYSKDGESYRGFTIYAGFEDSSHIPTKPTTGRWDSETDTVYFDDPDNEGWSVDVPSEELNIWKTSATFNSSGEKVEGWTSPVRYNAIIVKVAEYNRYYIASSRSSGVEAPDIDVDPTTEGWTINGNETSLSAEIPYLWSFERYVYSDGNIYQTNPVILRYFNAEAQVTFDQVQQFIIDEIDDELEDSTKRLGQISETESLITSQGGLTQILNSYNDQAHQKLFADIIANAEEATIKSWAGSEVANELGRASLTVVKQELDGIDGKITTAATQAVSEAGENTTAAINSARTEWNAADAVISNSVIKATYLWYKMVSGEKTTTPYSPNEGETLEAYETRMEADGWTKEIISGEVSVLQLKSDKIWAAVKDGEGNVAASVSIIGGATNPDGKIELDASQIVLNGNVITNAIQANGIAVGTGTGSSFVANTSISNEGILKTLNAHIEGNLYSSNGFFGTYGYESDGKTVKPEHGVFIGPTGLYSSNFYSQDNTLAKKGFGLFGNQYYLFSDDGSYITNEAIVTKKVSASGNGVTTSIDENGFIIKRGTENLAEFIIDPDNPDYIRLRIKGPNGYCDITGSGQDVHSYTETTIFPPKWTKVQFGTLNAGSELYLDFEQGHTWEDRTINAQEFDVPTINEYYRYSCGYKITVENGTTTTTYLNPSTGEYQDTKPEQDGKYYNNDSLSGTAIQLNGYLISYYPQGYNTVIYGSDTDSHYYYVYNFEFKKYVNNTLQSSHFVRAQKLHTVITDSGTLHGNETLEITDRTDADDWGK